MLRVHAWMLVLLWLAGGALAACDDDTTTGPGGSGDTTSATDGDALIGDTLASDQSADTVDSPDRDQDTWPNDVDNCPDLPNLDQADQDEDGLGDVCDNDRDGDMVPNDVDPRPSDPSYPGTVLPGAVYAHTSSTLYRMDVVSYAFTEVGQFQWPSDTTNPEMTDIAISQFGVLYGVSYQDVFVCHPATAECTRLAALPEQFNGLTLVPVGTALPDAEALVGIANSGNWVRLDTSGTSATLTPLGSYGESYTSSGDAFSISGMGTFASVNKSGELNDFIVEIDPATGRVLREIGEVTDHSSTWGLAGWTGRVFAFDANGDVMEIELTTGASTVVAQTGFEWWGAAVRTRIH